MTSYENGIKLMEVSCDGACCANADTFRGSFRECIEAAKDSGWRLRSDNGRDWSHFCSEECAERDPKGIVFMKEGHRG